jgi:hypothetical protein
MRASLLLLLALAGTAGAQPGADPPPPPNPSPYPPPPQDYPAPLPPPAPIPQPQPPPMYQPIAVQLTAEEHQLLQRGEISDGAHIGGGVANICLGFGIGQAIQGRWSERGWIFTVGQAAAVVGIVVGISESFDNDSGDAPLLFIGSYFAFLGLHIWGAVDAFVGPSGHNRKVRELRMRLGMPGPYYVQQRVLPYVQKTRDGGGTAGLVFRF